MKVLDGIAALFKFLLPYVSFALWDVNYRFHTTLTGNIVHDKILNKTYDIQSSGYPEYSCTGSTPCLSIGRNLPLRDLLEVANNDKLSMLQLSSAFCGPFPPSSVINIDSAIGSSEKLIFFDCVIVSVLYFDCVCALS